MASVLELASDEQRALHAVLVGCGQEHLFAAWKPLGQVRCIQRAPLGGNGGNGGNGGAAGSTPLPRASCLVAAAA